MAPIAITRLYSFWCNQAVSPAEVSRHYCSMDQALPESLRGKGKWTSAPISPHLQPQGPHSWHELRHVAWTRVLALSHVPV